MNTTPGEQVGDAAKAGSVPVRIAACAIVLIHAALCSWGAWRHSPTIDEPAYLASGISHWQFGRFDLCQVTPPLVRLTAAATVLAANPKVEWSRYHAGPGIRSEHPVGHDFLVANGAQSFWLFTLGRWSCLPFSLIGAFVCYRWARGLFGHAAALLALLLWCFSPNILAHAQLLTPDIGVTSLSLASCYAFWRWSLSQTWVQTATAGSVLGLAVLAKTNALALFPALTLGMMLHAAFAQRLRGCRPALQFSAALLIAVYVVNLGYGFEGSFRPLRDYRFFSRTFGSDETGNRFLGTPLSAVRVPLPSAFVEGIDLQRRDFENSNGRMKSYWRGKWYDRGWWWYYFYVIAVKLPLPTFALAAVGAIALLNRRLPRGIDCLCYAAIPGAALFGLACSQTGIGHSLRYILPALPFLFLIASAAASRAPDGLLCVVAVATTWLLVSSLSVFPHSLSYFNEAIGGPRNGHLHLLDGNVDWGQDLLYIRDWIDNHPQQRPIYAAYWGLLPIAKLGVHFTEPSISEGGSIPPGWYLISVNHLRNEYRMGRSELAHFLSHRPTARLTYAINVYHIPENSSNASEE